MDHLRGDDWSGARLGQALSGGLGCMVRARGSGVKEDTGIVPFSQAMQGSAEHLMLEPRSREEKDGPILLIQRFDERLVGPRAGMFFEQKAARKAFAGLAIGVDSFLLLAASHQQEYGDVHDGSGLCNGSLRAALAGRGVTRKGFL